MPPQKRKRGKSLRTKAESSATPADGPLATPMPKRRNRRGRLEDLPKMPLDIVFEILVYLEPLDLFNLSKTSKDLRRLLLSKSSERFWKAAHRNAEDLPDCPSFLSEPAFANLLFSHHCHKCLKPGVKDAQWKLRTRLCKTCLMKETMPRNKVVFSDVPQGERGEWLLPSHDISRKSASQHDETRVLKKDFLDLQQRLRKALDDGIPYKDFRETQQRLHEEIKEFAWVCRRRHTSIALGRRNELDQLKQARFRAVLQRLRDSGWGAELDYLARREYEDLLALKGMKEGKPLTEHAWNKLRGKVEKLMNQIREVLQEIHETDVWESRFKLVGEMLHLWRQEYDMLFPHLRQFVLIPKVRALLDRPVSESVTADRLAVLKPILPKLVSRWRKDAQWRFFDHLVKNTESYQGIGDKEASSLARTWLFRCSRCRCPSYSWRSYPEVLTHCCDDVWYRTGEDDYERRAIGSSRIPQAGDIVGFSEAISKVILACGLDPNKATRSEMDALTLRFCFASEWDRDGSITVLNWRHAAKSYAEGQTDDLMQLSEEDATRARELEDMANHEPLGSKHCAHCPETHDLASHLAAAHNITEPTASDYYYHPDGSLQSESNVYFVKPEKGDRDLGYFVIQAMKNGTAERRDIQLHAVP